MPEESINIGEIVREYYFEIEEVARQIGVDFSKARDEVAPSKDLILAPALIKEEKKKTRMGTSVRGNTLIITFYNHKGSRKATWKHTAKTGSRIKIDRAAIAREMRRKKEKEAKEEFKKRASRNYIEEYKKCENWTDTSPYLEKKGLEGKVKVKKMSDFLGDFLAIPVCKKGEIVGLQRIYDKKIDFDRSYW